MDASAAVAVEMEAVVGDEEAVSVVEVVLAVEGSVAGGVLRGDHHLDRPRVNTDHDEEEEGLLPLSMFATSIFRRRGKIATLHGFSFASIVLYEKEVYCMI